MQIKKVYLLSMILLFFINCKEKRIEIFKNSTDSFPRYLILNNDTLFDYIKNKNLPIKYISDRDTVHYQSYFNHEKTLVFKKMHFNDYGFKSKKILISFEAAPETNGINFRVEISKYNYLYIKDYDFNSHKYILKIKLGIEERKLFNTLFSELNQYKKEYLEKPSMLSLSERLLIVYENEKKEDVIFGDLYMMPEQLKVLIAIFKMYITKHSKSIENDNFQDLPSFQLLEYYEKKIGIGSNPEPEPIR
jgi:hypothetical protein